MVLLYLGAWVTSVSAGACMHKVMFWILKRNDNDEDVQVPQQYGARADKRRFSMTEGQSKAKRMDCRQRGKATTGSNGGTEGCREMPGGAGPQRVLEEDSLGTLVQGLVCAMRARPAAACGRGALVCFEPKRADRRQADWHWLEGVCAVNPGRHQAKRRALRASTLGLACAGLIGDALRHHP